MKPPPPTTLLVHLLLAGLALAGWTYGLHWKRVASGDLFTADEKLLFRFQDQIEILEGELAKLRERLHELEGEPTPGPEDDGDAPPPALGPSLPAPPQKIETH